MSILLSELKELWIGDLVHVVPHNTNGKYEGIEPDGKIKVRLGFNVHYFELHELTKAEDEGEPFRVPEEKKAPKQIDVFQGPELDLHIEKLNPHLLHQTPEQIIEFQVRKSEAFVTYAIKKRWAKVLIIHGKGTGILKAEVQHLVEGFNETAYTLTKNDGGALEVWFQY